MILSMPSQLFCNNSFTQHPIASASNSIFLHFRPYSSFTNKSRVFCSRQSECQKENSTDNHFTIPSSESEEEKQVHCEVDVISWRERRVKACVTISADVQSVWNVLTDYERLADFVPNLVCSERIDCPHPGRVWVAQQGVQRALYWHIEARVVLDLQEFPDSANGHELHFSMVDGDFKKFEGKWSLKAGQSSSTTVLSYEVNVIPRFNFPAIFVERIIRSDLPVNLQAVACRAEKESGVNQKTLTDDIAMGATPSLPSNAFRENYTSSNLGPLPTSTGKLIGNWGVFGKVCRLDRLCMVDEVHLRRFDGLLEDGGVHRCVAASITVKAPVPKVWNVLTAYESLPEIVPNLAISKILSRENNKVRILQEGCKGLLYMVLHARVILDLHEQLEHEISFEQVEGDFYSFQGKWILEQLGNQHTLLKYIVESKMQKNSFLSEAIVEEVIYEDLPSNLCAIRDCVEKREAVVTNSAETVCHVKYPETKSIPVKNVASLEHHKSTGQVFNFLEETISRQRPRVPGLQKDIKVLKSELLKFIQDYGQEGFMPMRKQLRLHGRVDLEKAITRMGGFRKIASLMNLSLAYKNRKPKGYWDNLENLQEEISRFQTSWGMDPAYMPSRKSFERAGRYDLARALEKWGGLIEVSRLLSLKVRHRSRQAGSAKEKKVQEPGNQEKGPYGNINNDKTYVPQDTQKWIAKLKHFDINWVE